MTLKHLAHSLPEVVPADLKPFRAFHSGSFTKEAVDKKIHNLLAQCRCQAFTVVRAADNRVKILHSLGHYMAPMGNELTDRNHNMFFGFKGDCTKRNDPPTIQFKTLLLTQIRGKRPSLMDIYTHFSTANASTIMPIADNEKDQMVCGDWSGRRK